MYEGDKHSSRILVVAVSSFSRHIVRSVHIYNGKDSGSVSMFIFSQHNYTPNHFKTMNDELLVFYFVIIIYL